MADYGVPEDDDGLLPWSWAERRLMGSRNFWVATANAQARPQLMPVWGVWMTNPDRFWFGCSPRSRKARNMRANPLVVVAPTDTVEVVSIEGRAVETTDGDISDAIDAFFVKYGPEMNTDRAGVEEFLTSEASFEVTPERGFGIIERAEDFAQRATRWRWD